LAYSAVIRQLLKPVVIFAVHTTSLKTSRYTRPGTVLAGICQRNIHRFKTFLQKFTSIASAKTDRIVFCVVILSEAKDPMKTVFEGRFFAEFTLSEVEGLRMTIDSFRKSDAGGGRSGAKP
jgi:hypothetical protein